MASLHPMNRAMNTHAWGHAGVPAGRNKSRPSKAAKARECATIFSSTMRAPPTERLQPSAYGLHRPLLNYPDHGQRRAALGHGRRFGATHACFSTASVSRAGSAVGLLGATTR